MPHRSRTSGRPRIGPIIEQRRPGLGIEHADSDLSGHQLDVETNLVAAFIHVVRWSQKFVLKNGRKGMRFTQAAGGPAMR